MLYKAPGIIIATMAAVASTITMPSTATAITLNITVDNLGPENGALLSPVWFSLHDGSFETFEEEASASSGLEAVAEDGLVGLEFSTPGFSFDNTPFAGLNANNFPYPLSSTIAGLFAESSAGKNGGVQGIVFNNSLGLLPGQSGSTSIRLNDNDVANNRFFNYASMLFPTNDGFIANNKPIEIFDKSGKFIGADLIVLGSDAWDAGTEVNDEVLSSLPFSLPFVAQGDSENGVVTRFPGFTTEEIFLINPIFANADFTVPGYQVARITVTKVPEPATPLGLITLTGLFLLRRRFRGNQ
ncbi:MAG: PEP-CTERM sorting domain-containing protein [Moorea sp. SIO4A3]|nr:PEP-CTERM sorting domain-containing protein [Moorena sp. SIO4A3]